MERYTSLYRFPKNQYTAGSPVLLAAGTLLKDSQTGAVLAQLKMQSLSVKWIRAVMVAVDASDVSGAPLEGVAEYQYLDLSVRRDEAFGQHQAIVLPDANTRCIAVRCTRVVFADGTSWEAAPAAMWSPLPEPETLEKALPAELVRQYCRDTTACAAIQCAKFGDLWRCTCGALNASGERTCHACGLTLDAQLAALDKTALREHLAAYEKAEAKKEEARRAKSRRTRKNALTIGIPAAAVCAAAAILVTTVIIPGQKYRNALSLLDAGDYTAGYAILEELGKPEEITQNKYDRAMALIDAEKYDSAYELLEEIGDTEAIQANKYDRAMEQIDAGEYEAAYKLLDGLEYKDSEEKQKSIWPQYYKTLLRRVGVGATISFGAYEQNNDASDGAESIDWIVLAKSGNRLLVISKQGLDYRPFDEEYERFSSESITWDKCSLRRWLNDTFYASAFSEWEKRMIPTVTVSAGENPEYDTNPGGATHDRIFLLSIDEAKRYFASDKTLCTCYPTEFASQKLSYSPTDKGRSWWWLRSPGQSDGNTAYVTPGGIRYYGNALWCDYFAVRPAMWISLED